MNETLPHTDRAALPAARQALALARQPAEVRVFSLGFSHDRFIAAVHPGWDRLIGAKAGAGLLRVAGRIALLNADRALWAGEDESVEIEAGPRLDLRVLYVRRAAPAPRSLRFVAVTALWRELVERCVERGWLDPDVPHDARLLAVISDELDALPAETRPLALAFPVDERARRAATHCVTNAHERVMSALELAAVAACSARTLERLFARETALGVVAWQRRRRLLAAAAAIAAGTSVTDAGYEAGYAGTSAFVTAFRQAFGATPGTLGRR